MNNALRKNSILLLDDNALEREIMTEFLKDEFEVITAENGMEGYQILSAKHSEISAILLDLIMPECDGYEFLKLVAPHSELSSIPVIVITSDINAEAEQRCLGLGALEFISKTVSPMLIKIRVRNLIKMREALSYADGIEIDELTGVYTKQAFMHRAEIMLKDNPKTDYDISIIDISNFKIINSFYGAKTGDEVIKYIASFGAHLTKSGLWGRYGIDQFISLVPSEENKIIYGDVKALYDRFASNAPVPKLNAKIAIYRSVDRSISVNEMCIRADITLDNVKKYQGNKIAFYDDIIINQQVKAFNFESGFDYAVLNSEFKVYYQPKINPFTEKIVGAEALVRWEKGGKIIPPSEFMDIFEANGQIVKLDEYVFRTVCEQQAEWKEAGVAILPISVNISRKSLIWPHIAEVYNDIAREYEISPAFLPIEITETAAVGRDQLKPAADSLSAMGFPLLMDDFGTGESNVKDITLLNFSAIKLDKSIIDTIGDERGELTLSYVIKMAKKMGIKVVAEGVETFEQRQFIMRYSCDEIQGFYYSKPLCKDDFEVFMKENLNAAAKQVTVNFGDVYDIDFSVSAIERVMENIPGGFFIYHADGNEEFIAVNKALLSLMECQSKEEFMKLTGGSFKGLVHKDDLEKVEQSIWEQIESGDEKNDYVEYRVTGKCGTIKWFRDYGHFVNTEEYGPVFYVFVSDATKAHDESERAAEIYRKIVDTIVSSVGSLYYIDLDNDSYMPYVMTEAESAMLGNLSKVPTYSELNEFIASNIVDAESKDIVCKDLCRESLMILASENRKYTNKVCLKNGANKRNYHVTAFPCKGDGIKHEIILGTQEV